MTDISPVISNLKPSGIRDFFELVMGMDDVISLGVGEPDFQTPRHIRESAIQSLKEGHTNYTSNLGMSDLREVLANHLEEKHDLTYDPETELLITTGVSEGLDLAMRSLVHGETDVLIPTPGYVSYQPTVIMAGGNPVTVPSRMEEKFRLTPQKLRDHAGENTECLLLNYPANPTGVSYSRRELRKLARIVDELDLVVVSDEIYGDLTFGSNHVPFPSLDGMRERTVLLGGFSKSYSMTGFRIGYAAGPESIISAMTKIHQYTMLCAPTLAQFAAVEALLNGESAVNSMRDAYERRRNLVVTRFREMGLDCVEPDGAFYVFPSIARSGMDSERFCRGLLEAKKVAMVPGTAFGPGGSRHVRVSFATDRELLKTALDRTESYLEELERTQPSSPHDVREASEQLP